MDLTFEEDDWSVQLSSEVSRFATGISVLLNGSTVALRWSAYSIESFIRALMDEQLDPAFDHHDKGTLALPEILSALSVALDLTEIPSPVTRFVQPFSGCGSGGGWDFPPR